MDGEALLEAVRAAITLVIGANRVPPDTGADTPLGDGGLWLDSLELLQLVVACEDGFGITFEPAEDLVGDGLKTLRTLAEVIRRRNPRLSPAWSVPDDRYRP